MNYGSAGVAPVLETPRLRLRGHAPDDLAARTAMMADPAVRRFIGGAVQGREENWARILRHAGHWALFGWGLFAIEERSTGRFVGECGLARFERGLGAGFDEAPEAAWMLATDACGQGHAREALAAAFGWYRGHLAADRWVCIIAPENTRSLRLAADLGFRACGEARYHGHTVRVHERNSLPMGAEAR